VDITLNKLEEDILEAAVMQLVRQELRFRAINNHKLLSTNNRDNLIVQLLLIARM